MMAHSRVTPLAVALVATLVAGCVLNKPPDTAALKEQALPGFETPAKWTAPTATAEAVADNWLASFKDDQLTAAVAEAIAHNADLRVGAARVEQARLYAKLAGAKLYPSVDVLARGGGKLSGDGSGLQGAVLTATWEVDLWGRVRYGKAASAAQARSAEADFAYARQSIAALVAKSWFLATEAGLQILAAKENIRGSEELVRLAGERERVGVGGQEDVYVARANVGGARDVVRQLELGREQAVRALELLLGRYPSAAAAPSPELPGYPGEVPTGLPSALLERRPDVIAAERRVAVAFNRIGEAKAALLPRISLTAGGSTISSDVFVLQDRANPAFSFGANLLAPIYQGGVLRAQVEIRTAEQRQAVAEYARTGQRAFAEVENALAAENTLRDREGILDATVRDSARALELAEIQYRVGSVDLRAVEQNHLALYTTRMSQLRVQTERRAQRVNLYLALGGGSDLPAMEPVAAK